MDENIHNKKPSEVFTLSLEKKIHDDSLLGQRSTQTLDTDFLSSNASAFCFTARRLASQFRATTLISPTPCRLRAYHDERNSSESRDAAGKRSKTNSRKLARKMLLASKLWTSSTTCSFTNNPVIDKSRSCSKNRHSAAISKSFRDTVWSNPDGNVILYIIHARPGVCYGGPVRNFSHAVLKASS